jgi:polysaccharide export outer membrane protein
MLKTNQRKLLSFWYPCLLTGIMVMSRDIIQPPSAYSQTSIPFPSGEQPKPLEFLPPDPPGPTFRPQDIPPATVTPPSFQDAQSRQWQLYRLNVDDQINITVPDFTEFSSTTIVDQEGTIVIPILGRITARGLTLDELETKIRYELGQRFLKEEPRVIAVLNAPRPVQLTILGEVVRPGYYRVDPNTPLSQLLVSIGGSTPRADLRGVIVRRPLVDGTVLEQRVDLYTPLITGEKLPDLRLQSGDTIIISRLEPGQETGYDRTLVSRTSLIQPNITVRVLAPLLPSGTTLRNVTLPNGSTFLDVIANLPITDRLRINVNDVSLLRFDTAKGKVINQSLNPEAALKGDVSQNAPLEDQDVIVVSRTLLGEIFAFFNIITQPIRDIQSFTTTINDFSTGFR